MPSLEDFLRRVDEIRTEEPAYELGHDGSDGLCDCIGLVIGAIRRAGGRWDGLHGTNWTARYGVTGLEKAANLRRGDLVFRAREPGETGYDLPERYRPGGKYYNGDLKDYYHVGVVMSADPVRIVHMTSPTVKTDTKIGRWAYRGRLKSLTEKEESMAGNTATIVLPAGATGSTVNLREGPGKKYGIITALPVGSTVDVLKDDGTWCRVRQGDRIGYMMGNYLEYTGQYGESNGGIDPGVLKRLEELLDEIESRTAAIWELISGGGKHDAG